MLFPKPLRDDPRYRPGLINAVYWLVFTATLVRFLSELALAYSDLAILTWLVLLDGFAQVICIFLYVWTMWYRIHPTMRELRAERGEEE